MAERAPNMSPDMHPADNLPADNLVPVADLDEVARRGVKIVKVGNASLEGATIMLLSCTMRRRIEELVQGIEHVELETTPDFFDIFVEGCMFNPMVFELS